MLDDIERRGETAIRELARKFDSWEGDFVKGSKGRVGPRPPPEKKQISCFFRVEFQVKGFILVRKCGI